MTDQKRETKAEAWARANRSKPIFRTDCGTEATLSGNGFLIITGGITGAPTLNEAEAIKFAHWILDTFTLRDE